LSNNFWIIPLLKVKRLLSLSAVPSKIIEKFLDLTLLSVILIPLLSAVHLTGNYLPEDDMDQDPYDSDDLMMGSSDEDGLELDSEDEDDEEDEDV
jgi:Ran GTPase-activating protein (RanGAP) involved in mRNA processing and transport